MSLWSREREATWLTHLSTKGSRTSVSKEPLPCATWSTDQHTARLARLPQAPPCPIVRHQACIPHLCDLPGLKIFEPESLPSTACTQLYPGYCGGKVDCSLPPGSGQLGLTSEGIVNNVVYIIRTM